MAKAENGEDGELMFEMEEGGLKEGSSTGDSSETELSSELDRRGLRQLADEKTRRRQQFRRICCMNIVVAVVFALLLVGSWRLSVGSRGMMEGQKLLNNGTALFAPTTILVSLDGFRADFLKRGITPRLNAFIEEGVSPIYMLPSFPSVTFPNHYTLVTGLYPESHGIVGNTFWDPVMQEEFFYTKPEKSMQPKWWGGEPLWVTAEKQGVRTAIHMWPGSEAHIMALEPSFLDTYNSKEPLPSKVRRVLELLDKPGPENDNVPVEEMRPQFIAAYVPNVDADGHKYGPNSTEIRKTIADVDNMLDQLFTGLEDRNLTQIVNVVVVSDHGMATTNVDRLIQLEDLVDPNMIEHIDGWPLYGLRPKDPADLQGLYDNLASEAAKNPNFNVYLRDVNMPERYHFSRNERIAPLWIVPKTGWAIVTKEEFNIQEGKAKGLVYQPRGLHGYDHEHPLMRAIFVARGPSFEHAPNSRVEVFRKSSFVYYSRPKLTYPENIEVYNILCDSLNLTPKPNNGSLRLPLKPVGLHTPEISFPEPADPVPANNVTGTLDPGSNAISISPIEASSAADPKVQPPHIVGVDPPDPTPTRPVAVDEGTKTGDKKPAKSGDNVWDYVWGKLDDLKNWFGDLVKGDKGGGHQKSDAR
jgi:predicted AlkP superfamily pyrophosphatase or phosphodiesterase